MHKLKEVKIFNKSFLLVLISIILSTSFAMYSLNRMAKDHQKDLNMLLAATIHDRITGELTEPVMAAKTMANDAFLINFLKNTESMDTQDEDIEKMKEYLTRLKYGLSYDSVFTVSSNTKRYYTADGLYKIIQPSRDEQDLWYSIFVNNNKPYALDVDIDRTNKDTWTIFINARIEGYGKLLGVCGVGVQMYDLQNLLYGYEKEYGVKINLIDAKGLVQVDTNAINIEKSYLSNIPIPADNTKEYIYRDSGDGQFTVTKYIENLGWYLVIRSQEKVINKEFIRVIVLNALLFALVVMTFLITSHMSRRKTHMLMNSSYIDQLTQLRNRRAYEEEITALSQQILQNDFVYVNADINGLKLINDTIGHAAGDELIRGAAVCLKNTFEPYGHVFRIGGDEFSAILHIPQDKFEQVQKTLDENIAAWHGTLVNEISISVGYVPRWEVKYMTLCEMIQESDQRMYHAKKEYYSQPGRNRRS